MTQVCNDCGCERRIVRGHVQCSACMARIQRDRKKRMKTLPYYLQPDKLHDNKHHNNSSIKGK